MDKKRLLLAFGFLVVCILIGYAMYYVFFKDKSLPPSTPGTEQGTPGKFPSAGSGQTPGQVVTPPAQLPEAGSTPPSSGPGTAPVSDISQYVDVAVISPKSDKNGFMKFYNEQDGKFYRLKNDGTLEPISDQVFFNVKHVTWSAKTDESIIEYPDGSNIYYNFTKKEQVTLPKHWEDFSFSPGADKITAKSMGFSTENRWLVTSDPKGNTVTLVEPLGNNADKVIVDWSPNNQVIALSLTGQSLGADRQEVLFVGTQGENFKSTIIEGRGLVSQWSPSGGKLLYSVYNAQNNFKPQLWIVNAAGDAIGSGRKVLNLDTWADKCAFTDDRFVYCAVPKSLPNGAGFAPEVADTVSDKMYKIDTTTGLKVEIPLKESATIGTLFPAQDNNKIFFTDKNKPGIFSIDLP